ncbi:MAG TPA: hypothetical protein VGR37_23250 [Longimicrobiaceae bacterium]|nr:hypothetical protein [Longimicrobiaceae bacterium]
MKNRIELRELESLIRTTASATIEDLADVEVESYLTGLVTSIGLRAVDIALEARLSGAAVSVESFISHDGFDFVEFPRAEIVRQLDASCGLGVAVCGSVLDAIDATVKQRLARTGEVDIELLGTAVLSPDRGMVLWLDENLKVATGVGALTV